MQLFQRNQIEESNKYAHTSSCQLHQRSIATASTLHDAEDQLTDTDTLLSHPSINQLLNVVTTLPSSPRATLQSMSEWMMRWSVSTHHHAITKLKILERFEQVNTGGIVSRYTIVCCMMASNLSINFCVTFNCACVIVLVYISIFSILSISVLLNIDTIKNRNF